MSSPENIRHHAAGHLAAAAMLAVGHPKAARALLGVVAQYAARPTVSAPPAVAELLEQAAKDPAANVAVITQLEEWFVSPFNTTIENSGVKFGAVNRPVNGAGHV